MKRTTSLLATIAIALCVLFLAPLVQAQKSTANPGPKYDLNSETRVKGVIEEVKVDPRPGEGTHLMLKTSSDVLLVHVAPEAFLKDIDVTFNKGDQVEVVASRIKGDEGPELLVKEIIQGGNTLTLRDGKGVAVWQDWTPPKR